jgi:hypothetical protein
MLTQSQSAVALMLRGQGFEIINTEKIKDTDSLNEGTRATVLEQLLNNREVMCRICMDRLNRAIGKLDISGEFGEWLTNDGSQPVYVSILLQIFHNMNVADPFVALSVQRFNGGILILEGLKSWIESVINKNPTVLSCTDIERLSLVVEEMEISYLPLNDTGDIDRSATPLVLHRSSDLCEIFKNHVIRTTTNQIQQPLE